MWRHFLIGGSAPVLIKGKKAPGVYSFRDFNGFTENKQTNKSMN